MNESPARIFIVEGGAPIATKVKGRLGRAGYAVCGVATSAEVAIDRIVAAQPDLVLMDISRAGGEDGIEAGSRLRRRLNLPVVLLTDGVDGETLRPAMAAEPFGFVVKPWDQRDLRATLEGALYRHRMERRLREANERLEERTAALAASEQRLLRAQRLAKVGHWVWSGPPGAVFMGGKVEYSDTAAAIFGVPAEVLAVPDADYIKRFVHPDDRERIDAAFADHRERRRKKAPLEYRVLRPDGTLRTIVEITEVVAGDPDRPTEVMGTIHDITERQSIETALRDNEARLRTAQHHAKLGWYGWKIGSDSYILSPEEAALLGLPAGTRTITADAYLALVHPADRARSAALFRECERSPRGHTIEYRICRPDGQTIWLRDIVAVELDAAGRPIGLIGTVQDVTEQKQVEEALRDSETRMRAFMDHAPMLIHLKDAEGRYQLVNREFERVEDKSESQLRGTTVFDVLPRDHAELLDAADREVLAHGRVIAREFHDPARGAYRNSIAVKFPVRDGDGNVVGVGGFTQDITDRKQAEAERQAALEQLRLSEERFSKLFYASPFSVLVATYPDSRIVNVNDAFLALFGFERQEVIGKTTSEINLWADQRDRMAFVDHIRRGDTVRDMEFAFRTKAGGRRTLLMSVEIVEIDGRAHSLAMSIDITERKRVALAMQAISTDLIALEGVAYFEASLRRMGPLLDAEIAFVTRSDPDRPGELRTVALIEDGILVPNFSYPVAGTPSATILEGRTHIIGAGVQVQYPGDTLLAEKGIEAYAGEPLFDDDGRPLGHLGVMSRRPFRDPATVGTILKMFGVATAAAMMREQVHRHDAWLQAILENAPTEIVLKDLDLRIMAASRNVVTERGSTLDGVVGKTTRDFFPPEIAETYEAADRKVIETGAPIQQEVREVEGGKVRFTHNVKFPLRDSSGRIIGLGSLSTDMTERRRIEDHLRQATKMEAIGKLTGGMAHDFNNYLAVVIGNLDLLKESAVADPAAAQLIDVALSGALRGAELTQSLLAFSRSQPLDPRLVDVSRHLEGVTKLLKRTLGEDIALTASLAPDLWPVRVDGAQLDSGIVNLANNARDAMPRGGRLSIVTRNVQLDEPYARMNADVAPGDYVLIEVSDNGAGMPPEILARVFEPFFSTKAPGHGTGLGLSMLYGFVKQSGGYIKIYSEVGHGTTVRLYLPRAGADAAADRDAAALARPSLPHGTETILVVEDNDEVRQTAVAQLVALGYRVVEAENGEAALRILDRREPHLDLLFTDIVMPGKLDGYEVAKLALERRPAIKILLTSGFPGDALRHNGKHAPHFSLLGKPYRRDELARAIRAAMESKSQANDDPA